MSYSSNPSSWNDAEPVRFSSRALRAELAENEPSDSASLSALLGQHRRNRVRAARRHVAVARGKPWSCREFLLGALLALAPLSLVNIGAIALILLTLAIDAAMIMIVRRVEQRNFDMALANALITGGGFAVATCFTAAIGICFATGSAEPDRGSRWAWQSSVLRCWRHCHGTAVAALSGIFIVLSANHTRLDAGCGARARAGDQRL